MCLAKWGMTADVMSVFVSCTGWRRGCEDWTAFPHLFFVVVLSSALIQELVQGARKSGLYLEMPSIRARSGVMVHCSLQDTCRSTTVHSNYLVYSEIAGYAFIILSIG